MELHELRGLQLLGLDTPMLTDTVLKKLREIRPLHALDQAAGADGTQPTASADIQRKAGRKGMIRQRRLATRTACAVRW